MALRISAAKPGCGGRGGAPPASKDLKRVAMLLAKNIIPPKKLSY